jgi:hypothetical protein
MNELYQKLLEKYSLISDQHKESKLKELPLSKDEATARNQINALFYCINKEVMMENTDYLPLWGVKPVEELPEGQIDGETYY